MTFAIVCLCNSNWSYWLLENNWIGRICCNGFVVVDVDRSFFDLLLLQAQLVEQQMLYLVVLLKGSRWHQSFDRWSTFNLFLIIFLSLICILFAVITSNLNCMGADWLFVFRVSMVSSSLRASSITFPKFLNSNFVFFERIIKWHHRQRCHVSLWNASILHDFFFKRMISGSLSMLSWSFVGILQEFQTLEEIK